MVVATIDQLYKRPTPTKDQLGVAKKDQLYKRPTPTKTNIQKIVMLEGHGRRAQPPGLPSRGRSAPLPIT